MKAYKIIVTGGDWVRTEALKKAQEAYEQKVIRVTVKLVKGQDDDLIQILEAKDNKQGFIKDLLRKYA